MAQFDIPKTAKISVLAEPRKMVLKELPIPEIGDDEILVKVEGCGICGTDLGEDIFDMAINPVDANDDTLGKMMAEKKAADELGDFELKPAEIKDEYKPSSPAYGANDDFGEFADLFAAGSAETSAPVEKKKPAAFRQSGQSDDPFNFGMDGGMDDTDMSADSDLSDLLL